MSGANSSMRPGRRSLFTGAWAQLREAFGGTDKLAEALNATPNMVQRWALHGRKPNKPTQMLIEIRAREKGVPNPLLVEPESGTDQELERWLVATGQKGGDS